MDILTKNQINYIINNYFLSQHKEKYFLVIHQLNNIILESNIVFEDNDNTNFGSYLVYRANGMPPLISYDLSNSNQIQVLHLPL